MAKYIIKESELRSVLSEIITEELSSVVNESLLGTIGKLGYYTLNPSALASRVGTSIANGTVARDTMNTLGGLGIGRMLGKQTATGKNNNGTKPKTRQEKAKEKRRNLNILKYNYGEPETDVVFGGRRKIRKQRIIVNNFLGTDESKDFGTHYVEKNQNSENSLWSKKLKEAEEEVSTNNNPRRAIRVVSRELNDWLKERDEAYRDAWKSIK